MAELRLFAASIRNVMVDIAPGLYSASTQLIPRALRTV